MNDDYYEDGYIKLAAAVVKSVAEDLLKAYKDEDKHSIDYLEKWLLSPHGQLYSMQHGEGVLRMVRKEYQDYLRKKEEREKAKLNER